MQTLSGANTNPSNRSCHLTDVQDPPPVLNIILPELALLSPVARMEKRRDVKRHKHQILSNGSVVFQFQYRSQYLYACTWDRLLRRNLGLSGVPPVLTKVRCTPNCVYAALFFILKQFCGLSAGLTHIIQPQCELQEAWKKTNILFPIH